MNITSCAKPAALTLCLLGVCSMPCRAQSEEDERGCSVATLRGTFGLHGSGSRPVPGANLPETHSTLALRRYDGKGGVRSWTVASQGTISGVTEGAGQSQPGTYEVNSDCTGKVELTIQTPAGQVKLAAWFVVVNRGLEIIEVPVTPGNVAVARLQKQ